MNKYKVGDLVWLDGRHRNGDFFYYEGKFLAFLLGFADHYYRIGPIENSDFSPDKEIEIVVDTVEKMGLLS